jgi:hypothetical protein
MVIRCDRLPLTATSQGAWVNAFGWRKSTRCDSGDCLELTTTETGVAIRDSKHPAEVLSFSSAEWADFLTGVKAGEFNPDRS